MKGQTVILKLENQLKRKAGLLEDLRNICRETSKHPPQISIHILQARKLPPLSHPKLQRIVQITLDSKDYRTYPCVTEGYQQICKWSESFLLPVESITGTFKLALIEKMKDKENVVGGVIFYLSAFADQRRHDGWYDVGYGEIRLAIRLLYDAVLDI